MWCRYHLQVMGSVKQEETRMPGPCGSEEAVQEVLPVTRVEEAGGRKEGTEEVSRGPDFCVSGVHLGISCPAGSGYSWELMKAYVQSAMWTLIGRGKKE